MSELNALGRALMMGSPDDITTGNMLAGMPEKSLARVLMEAARGAQGQVDRVPWWVKAPFQPMIAPGEAALATVATGASGAENIRRGTAEDDPWRTAGGIGELGLAGLSVLPAAGTVGRALMGTAPRAMATMLPAAGLSVLPGQADARDRREGEIGAIQGPAHLTQERDLARQQLQEMMMQQRLINEQHKRSGPETQRRALAPIEEAIKQQMTKVGEIENLIRAHAEQEHAKIMAERPLRERSPETVQAITLGGGVLAAGLPFANTIKHRFGDYLAGRRVNALADDVISGTIGQGRNPSRPSVADTTVALGQLRDKFPERQAWFDARPELYKAGEVTTRGAGFIGNSLKGGMIMGEASALPEQLDYLTYAPGHPTREAAAQSIRNPDYWKDRLGPTALGVGLGTMGQGLGHLMTPGSPVNQSRINTALGITKPQFTEDMAAIQRVRDAAKNPRQLIAEQTPIPPSTPTGPGRLPPPTGQQGTQPGRPQGSEPIGPGPAGGDNPRVSFGPPDRAAARTRIEDELRAGNAAPTIDEMQLYLKKELPVAHRQKYDALAQQVNLLRATGKMSDDDIAAYIAQLMSSGKHGLPAIAAGTVGLNAMQFGEPQQ